MLRPELFQKIEIMVDGGFRSGADVVKALALGARAVGLGRPFLYANGTHGEEGVARVLQSKDPLSRGPAASRDELGRERETDVTGLQYCGRRSPTRCAMSAPTRSVTSGLRWLDLLGRGSVVIGLRTWPDLFQRACRLFVTLGSLELFPLVPELRQRGHCPVARRGVELCRASIWPALG